MANYRQMLYVVGKVIESQVNRLNNHAHSKTETYPTLASGKPVQGSTIAWEYGNFAEIIPAGAIDKPFDIHYIKIESSPGTGVYEIHFFSGKLGEEVDIGSIRIVQPPGAFSTAMSVPFQRPIMPKGTRISAKMASTVTNTPTVVMSVQYHTYG